MINVTAEEIEKEIMILQCIINTLQFVIEHNEKNGVVNKVKNDELFEVKTKKIVLETVLEYIN